MNQSIFDTFVHRTRDLLGRRALLGGMSAALLAAGIPLAAGAKGKHHRNHNNKNRKTKACKRRVKSCRRDVHGSFCDGDEECIKALEPCCKKACKSFDDSDRCCVNAGFCG